MDWTQLVALLGASWLGIRILTILAACTQATLLTPAPSGGHQLEETAGEATLDVSLVEQVL